MNNKKHDLKGDLPPRITEIVIAQPGQIKKTTW